MISDIIPFIDLRTQYRKHQSNIDARIRQVLEHGQYILGPEVAELEKELAAYVGTRFAVGCSSGTDALLLSLMALGIHSGDAILTTPFTFFATAEVIALLGAVPVFVDIDSKTYNISPEALETAIHTLLSVDRQAYPLPRVDKGGVMRPKAVISVDLFGLAADYDRLEAICAQHNLPLIEDAAQAFGGERNGRRTGSFGVAAATSFFPAKPLGCYGDGGMIFTDNETMAAVMRSLVVHGQGLDKYENVRVGLNARLDTLQAAILLAKFAGFGDEVIRRQAVAAEYSRRIADSLRGQVCAPSVPDGSLSAWAQYTIRVTAKSNVAVQSLLRKRGVPTAIYYPKPLHLQTAFRNLGYRDGDFPVSECASREVLSLPFGPYLTADQQTRVVDALKEALAD